MGENNLVIIVKSSKRHHTAHKEIGPLTSTLGMFELQLSTLTYYTSCHHTIIGCGHHHKGTLQLYRTGGKIWTWLHRCSTMIKVFVKRATAFVFPSSSLEGSVLHYLSHTQIPNPMHPQINTYMHA